MTHFYQISVEEIDKPSQDNCRTLIFEVANHDDFFDIIRKVRAGGHVSDEEVAPFAIGLKLFGEIMLRHRKAPLFADLDPHFHAFVKGLKQARRFCRKTLA